ncbi:MAG: hypothetical protein ACPGO5_04385 [Patescibacteria group bacterium]
MHELDQFDNTKKRPSRLKTFALQQPEKVFVIFLVVAVFSIGAGIITTRSAIYRPFLVNQEVNTEDHAESLERFADLLEEQRTDTDGDGLPDNLEENVYNTSMYLADSDSDGLSDSEEISRGTNPNCPEGYNCSILEPSGDLDPGVLVPDIFDQEYIASLRQGLIQAGVDPDLVNGYSDQELVDAYQEIIAEAQAGSVEQEIVSGNASADTLRLLLEQGGVSKEILDQLSDDELFAIYAQVVTEQQDAQ